MCGPFARSRAALAALEGGTGVDAAVLDVNLGAETCAGIAARLRELGVPFLLHTGEWQAHGEVVGALDAPVVTKPAPVAAIVQGLAKLREPA